MALESNNFGVYCDRPVNQRYPVHADVIMCRGMCLPRRDFRNLFNISVSALTYYRDTLDVTIRGSPRFGFYASIRGFAVIAITDEGHIVGSFREQPDALIASCDPLLEGHTAFHAFANPARRFLRLTWSPDSKNFGRIRFRAWVVVRHNEVYVLDSDYVMNEMTGSEQVALQENFFGYVLSILNISRDVVEVVRDDGRQPTTSPATVSDRNTTTRASNQVPPRVTGTSPTPGEDAVTGAADSDDDEKDDDDGGGEDDRREDVTMTILVPTSGGTKMRLQIPTFRAFEDMFERRLMTVGFNISADDPFEKVTRTVPEFRDLFPKRPPPPSNDLAPFARTSGSPFFQSFGGGNSRRNIIQGGSSFGFAGQRPNQNQFVGGAQNQFGQQSFLGNTLVATKIFHGFFFSFSMCVIRS
nr:hypothetical protein BaRGS_021671 [Batillaria attramentaria]